ncbi:MAG: helix-turn-helix domain-containing protein [Kofleriaceae bacterium]
MRLLSPRQLASALGVSESSLKRWVDSGKIAAARTEGGHRKITLAEAVRFIRETGAPLAHPELLDMPEVAIAYERALSGDGRLTTHLVAGDTIAARGWLLSRYLAGASIEELGDGPIKEAMHALGELWNHEEGGIFIEHRGTDICLQALAQLRNTFEPSTTAPVALGGAPERDPYLLPTFLAATVVASAGMRAVNLGPDTPIGALQAAITHYAPKLVWISASSPVPAQQAREIAAWIASMPAGPTVLVGGRESECIAREGTHIRTCDSMSSLADIARSFATT